MSIVITDTIADEYANSYVDEAYADIYWDDHYSTVKSTQWANLSSGQKSTSLVHACLILEAIRFTRPLREQDYAIHYNSVTGLVVVGATEQVPMRYSITQALQFPRNIDVASSTGVPYIPEPVLAAQCEQAAFMLTYDESAIMSALQGITRESVSIGRGQISQTVEYSQQTANMFSPVAIQLLKPFFYKSSSKSWRA